MLQLLHDTLCVMLCDVWQSGILNVFYEMLHGMCVISVTSTSHHSKLNVWPGFVTNHYVSHMIYYVLHVTCVMLCKSFIIYEETGDQELCSWFFLFHFRIKLGFSLVEIVPGKSLSTPPFCVAYDILCVTYDLCYVL